MLSGQLGITIGFEDHVLAPGDSVSFDSTTPHRLHNDGREPVTAVWSSSTVAASPWPATPPPT